MDPCSDMNGYYVALIIITIVTIAIGLALSFYFIFIPSLRIAEEFDTLQTRGLRAVRDVTNLINTSTNLSEEVTADLCNSLYYTLDKLGGQPFNITNSPDSRGCALAGAYCTIEVIPTICLQYLTYTPCSCCCRNNPDLCCQLQNPSSCCVNNSCQSSTNPPCPTSSSTTSCT